MIVSKVRGVELLLKESLPTILILFAWDVAVVLAFELLHRSWMDQPTLPVPLIGSALVLFMSVRNNAAYARWWEARTLWGAVINNTRSFGRQAGTLLRDRPDLARSMAGYAHALRGGLRGIDVSTDLARLLPPEMLRRIAGHTNLPNAILYEIGREVAISIRDQGVDGAVHAGIDRILSDLANAQGGLERIRNTPLAMQIALMPPLLSRVFCVMLPLSMVQELGWITPFGSSLVGFLFVALDKVGVELEEPFSNTDHAVPMRAMTRTIEIDLLQGIGDCAPPPLQAEHGILP